MVLMIRIEQPQFTWIHIENPTRQSIEALQQEYHFHELMVEDLVELSGENKVEYYNEDDGQAVSVLMNFPKYDNDSEKYIHNPFIIIVSPKYIISVSKHTSKDMDKFAHIAEHKNYLQGDDSTPTFDLMYDIIDLMYDKSIKWLKKSSHEILTLQDHLEKPSMLTRKTLEDLMGKKINIVVLQHIFRPQRQLLHELKWVIKTVLDTDKEDTEDIHMYVDDLDAKLDNIIDQTSLLYETIKSLSDTYRSLIDLQTNQIVTRLTMVTVATGIMSVVGWFFGMNVPIPGHDTPYMFLFIVVSSIALIWIGYRLLKQKW